MMNKFEDTNEIRFFEFAFAMLKNLKFSLLLLYYVLMLKTDKWN